MLTSIYTQVLQAVSSSVVFQPKFCKRFSSFQDVLTASGLKILNTLIYVLPQCEWLSFTPIQRTGKITVLYILIIMFYYRKHEDSRFLTKFNLLYDLN